MTSLTQTGVTAAFAYDPSGRRSSKTLNGTTTSFQYDGLDIVREITGAAINNTLHGAGIDQPLARDGKYVTTNHQGSVPAFG